MARYEGAELASCAGGSYRFIVMPGREGGNLMGNAPVAKNIGMVNEIAGKNGKKCILPICVSV